MAKTITRGTPSTRPWTPRDTGPAGEARREAMHQAVLDAMTLAELRQANGVNQTALAKRLGTGQARISRIERSPDLYLSTLRGYVEALGGRLELVAVFDDGQEVRIATPAEAQPA
jgi:ribosome-binding protein aMBF1 (putative translation factor)